MRSVLSRAGTLWRPACESVCYRTGVAHSGRIAMQDRHPRRLHGNRLDCTDRRERYRDIQTCAAPRPRPNIQRASERIEPFDHADETEPFPPRGPDLEADAVVRYRHRKSVVASAQMHRRLTRATVLDRVLQGFLRDPVETEGQIVGDFR